VVSFPAIEADGRFVSLQGKGRMKKSDSQAADGEPVKSQNLDAPIELTPEQLEGVAGGFARIPVPDPPLTTTGKAK
jgi:hypothetical protein